MSVAASRVPRSAGLPRLCAACLLAAACAAAVGEAQTAASAGRAAPDALAAVTEPLFDVIAQEEARHGPLSGGLVEPLTALGLAYQEHGEHELAVAVLDRAFYVRRFNEGLHDLAHAPIVRRLIESELAVGRYGAAAALEQRLLDLARRYPDDLRSVPILRAAAERHAEYYERYLNHDLPFTISVNDPGGPARAGAFSAWQARRLYSEAIGTLLRNAEYGEDELVELEEALTRTYYLEARQVRSLDRGSSLYGLGRVSYERRVGYAVLGSATVYETARALVELADWSILFSRNSTGVRNYAEAHALLVEQHAPEAAIEALFPTDVPVFLPTFVESPLGPAAGAELSGHVDFDFEIGRYGQPRKARVVAVAGESAAERAKAVVSAIGRSRFRPSPFAETPRATTYRLRYSLADGTIAPRL